MSLESNIFNVYPILTELSDFCDIKELMTLKTLTKTSSRINTSFLIIVKRIENGKYRTIPVQIANKLYIYFLKNKNYKCLLKVLPFTESVVSYRIFIGIDKRMSEKVLGVIRRKPSVLIYSDPEKKAWNSPYYIMKETFGLNLEVFKYAVDLCIVYGLTHLVNEDEFFIDTDEDIPFLEYLQFII